MDFDREPLIPFANSNNGPSVSVGDLNRDGLGDIFIGGAKRQASALFLQQLNGNFTQIQQQLFEKDALNEDTASLFFDANGDGWLDLLVASGGNEFDQGKAITPRLYLNQKGKLVPHQGLLTDVQANISQIRTADLDGDLDLDLVLSSDQLPKHFGKTPQQYILFNDGKGNFEDVTKSFAPAFHLLGNVKDVALADINADGKMDMIALGHWMPLSVFLNTGNSLELQPIESLKNTHGWWKSLELTDWDKDGDLDIFAGNWGLNTKFKARPEKPITLYRNDFDNNGSVEPLITHFHKNTETPFTSKDELTKQLPFLNKKYLSYTKFAAASVPELFGPKKLGEAEQKKVYELRSAYFENLGQGQFRQRALPMIAQISQINDMIAEDLNNDGYQDLILVGNHYHLNTQLGRLDALHGLLLMNDRQGGFDSNIRHLKIDGQASTIQKLNINDKVGFIVGRNDDTPIVLKQQDHL